MDDGRWITKGNESDDDNDHMMMIMMMHLILPTLPLHSLVHSR